MFEEIFENKISNKEKLLEYGFLLENDTYSYHTFIMDEEFSLTITIGDNGKVNTQLIEVSINEEYVLYKTYATGNYVGEIRRQISDILKDISNQCFEASTFKSLQTLRIIDYVNQTYHDQLEFLWENFPNDAIYRRKDTHKWYGIIMTVTRNKIIPHSNPESVEIIDLRIEPDKMEDLLNKAHFYPGWHMNKKNWFTIILDDSVPDEEIFELLRSSYTLAVK